MNFDHFKKVLDEAPEEIKSFFMSAMFSLGMSMKQMEEHTLKEKNVGIEQSISGGGSLTESFVNGKHNKQTQEYKEKFYQILREADVIAKKKFGHEYFSNREDLLNEMGNDASKFNNRKKLLNEKEQNGLSELIQNKLSLLNQDYELTGQKPIYSSSIKLLKSVTSLDVLDNYISYIELYNKYGNNITINIIFQNHDNYAFQHLLNYFNQNKQLIINKVYGIEYYNNYKKHYYSLLSLNNLNIYDSSIILSYNSKRIEN